MIATDSIHQIKREQVIQSHLKHVAKFDAFDYSDFVRFVVDRYVECYRQKKKFSPMYIKNVIDTINRTYGLSEFNSKDVYKIYNNLNKAFNPENDDSIFYTSKGLKIKVDLKEIVSQNNSKWHAAINDKRTSSLYDETSFDTLLSYYKQHLDNYLLFNSATGKKPSKNDELALLIVFLAASPRRVNEILSLTVMKANELIIRNETSIKSKSGTAVVAMYVPFQFSEILERYVGKMGDNLDVEQRLFQSNYQCLYKTYRRNYVALFGGKQPISRVFHAFRNYFAAKHFYGENSDLARNALAHSSSRMTRLYANKQKATTRNVDMKRFLTNIYPL